MLLISDETRRIRIEHVDTLIKPSIRLSCKDAFTRPHEIDPDHPIGTDKDEPPRLVARISLDTNSKPARRRKAIGSIDDGSGAHNTLGFEHAEHASFDHNLLAIMSGSDDRILIRAGFISIVIGDRMHGRAGIDETSRDRRDSSGRDPILTRTLDAHVSEPPILIGDHEHRPLTRIHGRRIRDEYAAHTRLGCESAISSDAPIAFDGFLEGTRMVYEDEHDDAQDKADDRSDDKHIESHLYLARHRPLNQCPLKKVFTIFKSTTMKPTAWTICEDSYSTS